MTWRLGDEQQDSAVSKARRKILASPEFVLVLEELLGKLRAED